LIQRRSERFAAVMLRITTANLCFGDFRTANRTCFSDLDTQPSLLRKTPCGAEGFSTMTRRPNSIFAPQLRLRAGRKKWGVHGRVQDEQVRLMRIHKDSVEIACVDDWKRLAPSKRANTSGSRVEVRTSWRTQEALPHQARLLK